MEKSIKIIIFFLILMMLTIFMALVFFRKPSAKELSFQERGVIQNVTEELKSECNVTRVVLADSSIREEVFNYTVINYILQGYSYIKKDNNGVVLRNGNFISICILDKEIVIANCRDEESAVNFLRRRG
jgi:hypothetical protein